MIFIHITVKEDQSTIQIADPDHASEDLYMGLTDPKCIIKIYFLYFFLTT